MGLPPKLLRNFTTAKIRSQMGVGLSLPFTEPILIKMLFLPLQKEPLSYVKAIQYCALLSVGSIQSSMQGCMQPGLEVQTAWKVNEKSAWYMHNDKK